MQRLQYSAITHFLILIVITLLGTYLRLWHIADNPAWYSDETTHIEIAHNILQGEVRYFAIDDSWLIFARLPLFEYSLALVFQIFGVGIGTLRGFTAILGILTSILLYFVIRDVSRQRWFALMASASFAFLPQAILYNRFGFSYNLLLPLIVIILWGYYRYRTGQNRGVLVLSAICIGLGCISDVLMWSFLPTLILIAWGIHWRDMIWSGLIAIVPFALYAGFQLMTVPDAFLFDLGYTIGRTGGISFIEQIRLVIENYLMLLPDWWWLIAFIGLVLADKQLRYIVFVMFVPLVFVGRTVPLYSLSAYYLLPFLPLIAIGIASFLLNAWNYIQAHISNRSGRLIVIGLLTIPIGVEGYQQMTQVENGFNTPIDAFLIDAHDAYAVADYINMNDHENDLIVTTPPIGWLLKTHVAEMQMSAIAHGLDAVHLPGYLPQERFAFETDYRLARYVVLDDLWRNWGAVHIPQVAEMIAEIENWELVFEQGQIQVYANPRIDYN